MLELFGGIRNENVGQIALRFKLRDISTSVRWHEEQLVQRLTGRHSLA